MEDFVSYMHHANLIEILYPSINFYQSSHIQIDKNWIIKKSIERFHDFTYHVNHKYMSIQDVDISSWRVNSKLDTYKILIEALLSEKQLRWMKRDANKFALSSSCFTQFKSFIIR